jgi:hypothetical protein
MTEKSFGRSKESYQNRALKAKYPYIMMSPGEIR